MADSELEEGELPGEVAPQGLLGGSPHAIAASVALPAAYDGHEPKEQLLAPRPDGRAPYFADPDSEGWSGRRSGGGKKKRKKAAAGAAGFVDIYGQGAAAALEVYPEAGPVRLADVQNLVLWVLGDGANPRWCFVKNKPLVSRVVLLVAHGLDSELWESDAARAALPTWRAHLGEPVVLQARNATLAPGSTVHSLLTVPQTKKRRREEDEDGAAAPAAAAGEAAAEAAPAAATNGSSPEAPAAAAGEADVGVAAAGDTSAPAGPAAAKRMKVASTDDVSSRIVPQLASAAAPGAEPGAGTAPSNELPAEQQQQQRPLPLPRASIPGSGGGGARRPPCTLPPSHYVLSLDQLAEHGYPLPRLDDESGQMVAPDGYVATQPAAGAPQHDLVALDCEMCVTAAGFELTRATLIDRQGQVLLDELVLPHNPITDHNTRYSGITAEMLEGVTTRLEDVRARLLQLIAAETLLVAHSGDNDLQALRLMHANVIDTSVLYPHPRGPPYKSALRVLASRHLLRTIQQGEHDPVEDARAALDLALLKFERGPSYAAGTGERGDRLLDVLGAAGRRSTMVDRLEVLTRHCVGNCSAVAAEGDAAVAEQLAKEAAKPQVDFLWGQLTSLQQFYEARLAAAKESGEPEPSAAYRQAQSSAANGAAQQQQRQQQQGEEPPPPPPPLPQLEQPQAQQQQQQQRAAGDGSSSPSSGGVQAQDVAQPSWEEQQAAALQSLDRSLARLWEAAPAGTLFVVATGQGDTAYTRFLQEHKWQRQQGLRHLPPWSPECEAHLAAACDRALAALCFAAIKPPGGTAQQPLQQQA